MALRCLVLLAVTTLVTRDLAAAQTAAPRQAGVAASCVTSACHGEILAGKVLHGPTAQRKCAACHQLTNPAAHRFTLTVPQDELCTFCHVQTNRTYVHEPVADGDCTGCHDPHGSNHRFMLIDDPASKLCFHCHPAEEFRSKKHVHGPVDAGACVLCHEAHSSWHPKLLARPDEELCLFCHADVVSGLDSLRHVHPPVRKGRCTACHDPHASDHPAQLRQPAPQLCFSCHEHDTIRRLTETAGHVHGALETDEACDTCHLGHGGPLPALLAEPTMSLCLSCHAEPLAAKDGSKLTNMAQLLKNNPNHHGPIRRADCSACHNPHASSHYRLLIEEYPKLFYAPFDLHTYQLCFACHRQEMVTEADGYGVTGFRDGERNLHFVHVNREKKGRTCRACHEVHASKRPFHMSETVPFGSGGWEMEINFTALPTGGRCAPACHDEQTYSRSPAEKSSLSNAGLTTETDR